MLCSTSRHTLVSIHRPGAEVASGAGSQVEDLSSQSGDSNTSRSYGTAGTGRQLKPMSQWGLQHCIHGNQAIAAPVLTWQNPSEAAALLEALVRHSAQSALRRPLLAR